MSDRIKRFINQDEIDYLNNRLEEMDEEDKYSDNHTSNLQEYLEVSQRLNQLTQKPSCTVNRVMRCGQN